MTGCSAINCKNRHEQGFRLFAFPSNNSRKKIWVRNMRRGNWTPTASSRLCEKHFEAKMYERGRADGIRKLKPNAVPTLFDEPSSPPKIDLNPKESQDVVKTCVIKGCDSNSTIQPDIGYFPFPTKKSMLKKWTVACNLNKEELQLQNSHICAKHFIEEDFITELKIEGDQTICIYELRNDVIPTLNLSLETIKPELPELPEKNEKIVTNEMDCDNLLQENEELEEKIKLLESKVQILRSCEEIEKEKYMKISERYKKLSSMSQSELRSQKLYKLPYKPKPSPKTWPKQKELLSKIFSQTQIRAFTKQKPRWVDHDFAIAYTIRYLSNTQFYEYFTETLGYPFPGRSTIQRWKGTKLGV